MRSGSINDRIPKRRDRKGSWGGEGGFPAPLWFVLILSAAIVWAFVFLLADRGEGEFVQAVLIGAVSAMLVSGLLVVRFLDYPYSPGSGSLKPTAMEETFPHMDETIGTLGLALPAFCDGAGTAI